MAVDSYKWLPPSLKVYFSNMQVEKPTSIPWTPLPKPLPDARVALVTTGGINVRGVDPPFDYVPASQAAYDEHLDALASEVAGDLHAPDVLLVQEAEDQDICSVTGATLAWRDTIAGQGLWVINLQDLAKRNWTFFVPDTAGPLFQIPDVRDPNAPTTEPLTSGPITVDLSARSFENLDFNSFRFSKLSRFRDRSDAPTLNVILP